MKKIITILSLFCCVHSFAQDSTTVEQYCEVVATGRLLSNKVTIDIDYGEQRNLFRDYRLKDDNGNLQKFNSVIDAINFVGKQGWKLVNAFPVAVPGGSGSVYHYVFKKVFDKSSAAQ